MAEINYKTATAMISLFDCVYKKGVEDAYRCTGADHLERFIEMLPESGMYGTCTPLRIFDWSAWRSCLHFWIMDAKRFKPLLREYLMDVWQCKGVAACIYPISFDFYAQGVLDYRLNPSGAALINNFKKFSRINFAKFAINGKNKQYSIDDYIAIVQNFAYLRINKLETLGNSNGELFTKNDFVKFSECFWRVLMARRGFLRSQRESARLEKIKNYETMRKIRDGQRTDD